MERCWWKLELRTPIATLEGYLDGVIEPTPQIWAMLQIIQDALNPLEGQFVEKGLELQIHVPENLPPVKADPTRTAQILTKYSYVKCLSTTFS